MFVDSIDSIDLVVGPHKCLSIRSIRSICQIENSYFRSEKCRFPFLGGGMDIPGTTQ